MTVIITGMRVVGGAEEGVQVEGRAGVRGATQAEGRGAEPPDSHETNLKCFMNKLCHEMMHYL